MKININDIKALREETGASIGVCKKALEQCGGDIKSAVNQLKIMGISSASKKMDRVASDGLIAMHIEEKSAALIELNCETDFVARNERFQSLAAKLALLVHNKCCNDVNSLRKERYDVNGSVEEVILNEIAVLGEKIDLSRVCYIKVESGVIAGYVHNTVSSGLGKIGALVTLESNGDAMKLKELGKQLAMHVIATKPEALSIDDLDQEKSENERLIIAEQVKKLNKPEEVMEKIINGRMAKYYEEAVMLEQIFVVDGKTKIADLIKLNEANLNCTIKLSGYKLFVLGG